MRMRPPCSSLAAVAALAGALSGCTSYGVTVQSASPDEAVGSVRSLFVVLGAEKDLIAPPGVDAIELVDLSKLKNYDACLVFEPSKNAKGQLVWKQVSASGSNPARLKVKLAPLTAAIEGDLVENRPDVALLVLAAFQSGVTKTVLLKRDELLELGSFVVDLQGQELKRR
jgi:hypothetical protein